MQCGDCASGAHCCDICNLRFCGQPCWDASAHALQCQHIGTAQELAQELIHRQAVTKGTDITTIVGPHSYAMFSVNGVNFFFMGESHQYFEATPEGKLDITITRDTKLHFEGGVNANSISAARLLYAAAAASKRKHIETDIFLEWNPYEDEDAIHFGGTNQKNVVLRGSLGKIHNVAVHLKCIELTRDKQSACDVFPTCRFHLVDYRQSDEPTRVRFISLFYVLHFAISGLSDENFTLVREFVRQLGADWQTKYYEMARDSDDFSSASAAWLEKPVDRLLAVFPPLPHVQHFMFALILLKTGSGLTVHPMRKQYLKLHAMDAVMADRIKTYANELFHAYKQPVFQEGEPIDYKHHAKQWVYSNVVYMDAPALCRMFRFPSVNRFIYSGATHLFNYYIFFTRYLNAEMIDGVEAETLDNVNHPKNLYMVEMNPAATRFINDLIK